ncbi:MAG TPA: type II toxin-antitoxin system RelE/ParE family toxin [Pseudolabrys sp.]|jgi:plasmid stabilization system protein ParE
MRVRFTRRSQADATAIFNYLDEKSPQGANSVKRAFKKAVDLIGEYPHVGRHSGEQDARATGRPTFVTLPGDHGKMNTDNVP